MKRQKHLKKLLMECFPYPKMRENQRKALEVIGKLQRSMILELPTGSGKTAIGYTVLKALQKLGQNPLFYIAPTKTIVEQVKRLHPEVQIVFGRNEYPCLYYKRKITAEEAPCSMLNCPHRVNQETGEAQEIGVEPCPYLLAKYQAKQGGIVVSTVAFYLFAQWFSKEWPQPAGLIIDEAHRIAKIARNCLSYEITDYHLKKAIELLKGIDLQSAQILNRFLKKMVKIAKLRSSLRPTLLEPWEVKELMNELERLIADDTLISKIQAAVREGKINPEKEHETLKKLEVIVRNLSRYWKSFQFSLDTEKHHALNYTYAFCEKAEKRKKVRYRLFIKNYYVVPIIQRILSPFTIAYSATIGDSEIFSFETGIKAPFYSFNSEFPAKNTRIFLPTDTPNLAVKARRKRDPIRALRKVARSCKEFRKAGLRSLVVVVSEIERQKFLKFCQEEGVEAVSYSENNSAKEVVKKFIEGKGDLLVGTVANYGEGIDLPGKIASVIFFLRPGYPKPTDPMTIFEERRFGSMRWKLWNWRVMIEALQVRGRNIRSAQDLGVTIFVSQQFRRFLPAILPEWLRNTYRGEQKLEKCIEETKKLFK